MLPIEYAKTDLEILCYTSFLMSRIGIGSAQDAFIVADSHGFRRNNRNCFSLSHIKQYILVIIFIVIQPECIK